MRTDSDVIITEHVGDLTLNHVTIVRDFAVMNINGDVTAKESNFNLEDVTIAFTGRKHYISVHIVGHRNSRKYGIQPPSIFPHTGNLEGHVS